MNATELFEQLSDLLRYSFEALLDKGMNRVDTMRTGTKVVAYRISQQPLRIRIDIQIAPERMEGE